VNEFGADVNQDAADGATPVAIAASMGNLDTVGCLVHELAIDVNITTFDGYTPLMFAAQYNSQAIIKHLVHKGACVRAISMQGTAITQLECARSTAAQIAYLEVRECCANPGCDGSRRKRCAACKETRYCEKACQVMHWRAYRVDCRPPIDDREEHIASS
jgi:hypothetical protein